MGHGRSGSRHSAVHRSSQRSGEYGSRCAHALSSSSASAAVAAGAMVVNLGGSGSISARSSCVLLAAALLGPASACAVAVIAEVAAPLRSRITRRYPFAEQPVRGDAVGAGGRGADSSSLAPGGPEQTVGFYLVVALAGCVRLCLSFVIAAAYTQVIDGRAIVDVRDVQGHGCRARH